tara:strand:+ start:591 stop:806 length:216 start_codon:yes stop_codon:yes gene_type:complete
MYEIEYFIDINNPVYLRIKTNYLPRSNDDVTINGKNYQVINVKHILNTDPDKVVGDTMEEKFIVLVQERKD